MSQLRLNPLTGRWVTVAVGRESVEVIAHERAVTENRAAFRSVERFDVVGWSTLGAGAAFLGAGAFLFLTHSGAPEATVSLRRGGLALTTSF